MAVAQRREASIRRIAARCRSGGRPRGGAPGSQAPGTSGVRASDARSRCGCRGPGGGGGGGARLEGAAPFVLVLRMSVKRAGEAPEGTVMADTNIPITVYGDVDQRAVDQLERCARAGD